MDASLLSRRSWLVGSLLALSPLTQACRCPGARPPSSGIGAGAAVPSASELFTARLEAIERRVGGLLGVAVLDTGSGTQLAFRGTERFPLCSTFKLLLAAAVLARVDAGTEQLERSIAYTEADLLDHAPVTRAHVSEGSLTVRALCAAAVETSDNTAANLLLTALGGPEALTLYLRSLGDDVTRLDRNEPTLNTALPGDLRDTTTPTGILRSLRPCLVGDALSASSRQLLLDWLIASPTGLTRLRAGLPEHWRAGDKTGTGARGSTNDLAILWPPGRAPVLVAAYSLGSEASLEERSAALADVARALVAALED
jgi:beta-lactamase class A